MKIVIIVAGALPLLALLFVLGRMGFDYVVKQRMLRELPEAARALGLEEVEAGPSGRFGKFAGEYRGRRLRIQPEAFGLVTVPLSEELRAGLSTLKNGVSLAGDLPRFESGDSAFDSLFEDRRAAPEVAERLRRDAALRGRLVDLATADALGAGNVFLEGSELRINAAEARSPFSYMRAETLADRLDAAVALAREAESSLR